MRNSQSFFSQSKPVSQSQKYIMSQIFASKLQSAGAYRFGSLSEDTSKATQTLFDAKAAGSAYQEHAKTALLHFTFEGWKRGIEIRSQLQTTIDVPQYKGDKAKIHQISQYLESHLKGDSFSNVASKIEKYLDTQYKPKDHKKRTYILMNALFKFEKDKKVENLQTAMVSDKTASSKRSLEVSRESSSPKRTRKS